MPAIRRHPDPRPVASDGREVDRTVKLLGNIGVRIAVIAIIAVVGLIFRDRLTGNATDLQAGDCFDEASEGLTVKDVQHHPCTEGHTAEVILVSKHPAAEGAAMLTNTELETYVSSNCVAALFAYAGGQDKVAKNIEVGVYYPLEEDWSKGERDMTCYAYTTDGAKLTSSIKAAK